MEIKAWLLDNPVVKVIYRFKFYLDLGIGQISAFTGKLPEVMAFLYLFNYFGIKFEGGWVLFGILIAISSLFTFGYIWKKLGIYDTEVYINASKNPFNNELLIAAKKINSINFKYLRKIPKRKRRK